MAGSCASWTIFAFSIITFALSVTSVAHCSFLKIGDSDLSYSEFVGVGLYSFEFDGGCEAYPDLVKDQFEWSEKLPRAMGVIAAVLTGIGMLVVAAMQLALNMERINRVLWNAVRIILPLAIVAQLLTFTFFASDICQDAFDTDSDLLCLAGPAGIVSFANVIFLAALSIMACCNPPPTGVMVGAAASANEPNLPQQDLEEQYTDPNKEQEETPPSSFGNHDFHAPQPRDGDAALETEMEISPDGTRKITKKFQNPDGSITTTTFIEKPGK